MKRQLFISALLASVLTAPANADYSEGRAAYIAENYKLALKELTPFAEKGDVKAQHMLGFIYKLGFGGVTQDYKKATFWFRKAAEQGDAEAQFQLGFHYERGRGVPQDFVLAYMLYNLASAGGEKEAGNFRDQLSENMTRHQIEEGQALGRAWKVGTPLPLYAGSAAVQKKHQVE